jgi:hypothetical protein
MEIEIDFPVTDIVDVLYIFWRVSVCWLLLAYVAQTCNLATYLPFSHPSPYLA